MFVAVFVVLMANPAAENLPPSRRRVSVSAPPRSSRLISCGKRYWLFAPLLPFFASNFNCHSLRKYMRAFLLQSGASPSVRRKQRCVNCRVLMNDTAPSTFSRCRHSNRQKFPAARLNGKLFLFPRRRQLPLRRNDPQLHQMQWIGLRCVVFRMAQTLCPRSSAEFRPA